MTLVVLIGFLLHPIHHVDPAWFAVLGAIVLCVCDAPMEVERVVHVRGHGGGAKGKGGGWPGAAGGGTCCAAWPAAHCRRENRTPSAVFPSGVTRLHGDCAAAALFLYKAGRAFLELPVSQPMPPVL